MEISFTLNSQTVFPTLFARRILLLILLRVYIHLSPFVLTPPFFPTLRLTAWQIEWNGVHFEWWQEVYFYSNLEWIHKIRICDPRTHTKNNNTGQAPNINALAFLPGRIFNDNGIEDFQLIKCIQPRRKPTNLLHNLILFEIKLTFAR